MSNYAKQQEYRIKRILEETKGVELLKYYGSREKNKGDFLVEVGALDIIRLRIDHKSTRNTKKFVLQPEMLPKLSGICLREMDEEGMSNPCITFNILGNNSIYIITRLFVPTGCPIINLYQTKKGFVHILEMFLFHEFRGKAILHTPFGIYSMYRLRDFLKLLVLNTR